LIWLLAIDGLFFGLGLAILFLGMADSNLDDAEGKSILILIGLSIVGVSIIAGAALTLIKVWL
jgi:hypothetical protein